MYDAHSIESITERLASVLPRTITITKHEPMADIGYVTTFDTSRPVNHQAVTVQEERNSKLVGVLFCHPKSPLARSEILGHLAQFHVRSGDAVDFFCVGYGENWPPDHFADREPVATIKGENWLFSEQAFSNVVDELAAQTTWTWSGETELILLAARKDYEGAVTLDYDSAIVCNLEAMSQAGAFSSVRSFFEKIIRVGKTRSEGDPTWVLSDRMGINIGKSALKEAVLSVLPKALSDAYRRGEHFAVRSIAKRF